MRKRKLPPVKQTRVRKGNHPSNPYAEGLTDREGLSIDIEPVLEIRASERHGPETVEMMAKLYAAMGFKHEYIAKLAVRMREWREINSGGG